MVGYSQLAIMVKSLCISKVCGKLVFLRGRSGRIVYRLTNAAKYIILSMKPKRRSKAILE